MFNVGDKVELRGAGVGLVVKNMMGDDYVIRMNNGQNRGANRRAMTLVESVEDLAHPSEGSEEGEDSDQDEMDAKSASDEQEIMLDETEETEVVVVEDGEDIVEESAE